MTTKSAFSLFRGLIVQCGLLLIAGTTVASSPGDSLRLLIYSVSTDQGATLLRTQPIDIFMPDEGDDSYFHDTVHLAQCRSQGFWLTGVQSIENQDADDLDIMSFDAQGNILDSFPRFRVFRYANTIDHPAVEGVLVDWWEPGMNYATILSAKYPENKTFEPFLGASNYTPVTPDLLLVSGEHVTDFEGPFDMGCTLYNASGGKLWSEIIPLGWDRLKVLPVGDPLGGMMYMLAVGSGSTEQPDSMCYMMFSGDGDLLNVIHMPTRGLVPEKLIALDRGRLYLLGNRHIEGSDSLSAVALFFGNKLRRFASYSFASGPLTWFSCHDQSHSVVVVQAGQATKRQTVALLISPEHAKEDNQPNWNPIEVPDNLTITDMIMSPDGSFSLCGFSGGGSVFCSYSPQGTLLRQQRIQPGGQVVVSRLFRTEGANHLWVLIQKP